MSEWIPQYPVNFAPDGDATNTAIEKLKNEISLALYPLLSRVRTFDAGPTAPSDPVENAFWLDTSDSPAVLKMYDGSSWVADVSIGVATDALLFDGHTLDEVLDMVEVSSSELLDKIKEVDGSDSGLNADMVDGKHASDFMLDSDFSGSMVPDYSSKIQRTENTTYTAGSNGYFAGAIHDAVDSQYNGGIYVAGHLVERYYSDYAIQKHSFCVPVASGDTYKLSHSGSVGVTIYWIPVK